MAKFSLRVVAVCDTEQGQSYRRYFPHEASYSCAYRCIYTLINIKNIY